jgi:hypothetical protein
LGHPVSNHFLEGSSLAHSFYAGASAIPHAVSLSFLSALRRYAHVLEDMRQEAAQAMDDLF